MKRGFTIVELLMVVGIIAVLITISVSAVTGTMKQARTQRGQALCTLIEQGIATYYAQKGEWPVEPGDPQNNAEVYTFTENEVQDMIRKVVEQTKDANPMLDVSGLYVASKDNTGPRARGMDFMTAIHGSRQNARKLKLKDMRFGYPDAETGYFRNFTVTYSPTTDKVTVSIPKE